jgi:hypothetical protein
VQCSTCTRTIYEFGTTSRPPEMLENLNEMQGCAPEAVDINSDLAATGKVSS